MKLAMWVGAAVVAAAACVWYEYGRPSGDLAGPEARAVRRGLSAAFGGSATLLAPLRARVELPGKVVCGRVGTPVGPLPFIGYLDAARQFTLVSAGGALAAAEAAASACRVRGLTP